MTAEQLQRFRATGPLSIEADDQRALDRRCVPRRHGRRRRDAGRDRPRLRRHRDARRPAHRRRHRAPPSCSAPVGVRWSRWPPPTRRSSPTRSSGPRASARRCPPTSPTCSTGRSASSDCPTTCRGARTSCAALVRRLSADVAARRTAMASVTRPDTCIRTSRIASLVGCSGPRVRCSLITRGAGAISGGGHCWACESSVGPP